MAAQPIVQFGEVLRPRDEPPIHLYQLGLSRSQHFFDPEAFYRMSVRLLRAQCTHIPSTHSFSLTMVAHWR